MFKWICPFCNQSAIITDDNYHKEFLVFSNLIGEEKVVVCEIIECPTPGCNHFTFNTSIHIDKYPNSDVVLMRRTGDLIKKWNLIPESKAKPFPDYIPKPILEDYTEACLIKELSPKASATLSRRCLQGMIRDFWRVKKNRLIDEIDAIKDKVEPLTWEAIDSVRKVGNIGAHMEKDINLIIEVDPNEADLLISLIETLIKDWYITRHERQEMLRAIKELGDQKESQKEEKRGLKKSQK